MRIRWAVLCLLAAAVPASSAGEPAADALARAESRLRAIYERREFAARFVRPAAWLGDGSGFLALEDGAAGPNGRELVQYETATGRRSVLLSLAQLVPAGRSKPLVLEDCVASPDGSLVLLQANARADESGGGRRLVDYWLLERQSGVLRELLAGADRVPLRSGFSPDGRRFLYVREHNLYARDLRDGRTATLTTDGEVDAVMNGVGSGAAWSPDGRQVVYVQSDSRAVGLRPMLDQSDPSYPKVRYRRFARVGTTIPTLRVGVVEAGGGATRWLPVPTAPEGFYLGGVSWAGSPDEVLVERLSRGRDAREFLLVNVAAGRVATMYRETDPAWVDASYQANAGLEWIRDGRAFVLLSERDGWRHAYTVSRDGSQQALLTPGASDVIARGRVDERAGFFYYLASPENATQRYLFRVRLDGTGAPERVSPTDQHGTHGYDFSPDGRWAVHTYATYDTPPVVELVELPAHRVVRVLEDNAEVRARAASWIRQPIEFLKLGIGGGVEMDAWLMKPPDFDPSRKYPVFVFVYGEPHLQTVTDDWSGGGQNLFSRAMAEAGYLVVSMDNRGTPAPKGAAWRRAVYGSLGPLSTDEQAAGLRELGRTRSYVDLSRVGIWGWSGGGSNTLNAMFRKPDDYHVGIAVAPKPQPHLYNAGFQEIYMRTREENPEGYRTAAAIHYAEGLKGRLLIVHGTGETNTHLQITEGLVDRLIELGKRFDYMTYPNRDHGLSEGPGSAIHVRLLIARYLIEHLPPGPRPADPPRP
jgi:dipeptidyl-peptidase-4